MAAFFDTQLRTAAMTGVIAPACTIETAVVMLKANTGTPLALTGGSAH